MIREIGPRDEREWRALWRGYLDFYETELTPEITDETWARLLAPEGAVRGLVAEADDGTLVGLAHYVLHPRTWTVGDACYLEDLFVAPAARGSGVGRELIDGVAERARAAGCTRVYWHTHRDNAAARRLYDSFGLADDFVRYVVELPAAE